MEKNNLAADDVNWLVAHRPWRLLTPQNGWELDLKGMMNINVTAPGGNHSAIVGLEKQLKKEIHLSFPFWRRFT
jgi:hypothetical protein